MKNKKKHLPLLLLALLLITAGAYGTRAYFTDSTSHDSDITLTLGNLEVEETGNKNWTYNNNGNTALVTETDSNSFKNAQPGDGFSKTFTFTNTGSLDQVLTVDTNVSGANPNVYEFSFKDTDGSTITTKNLKAGQSLDIVVTLSIPTGLDNTYNTPGFDDYFLENITNALTVTASQTNAQ